MEFNHIHMWEWNGLQYFKVSIVADDVVGISNNGAVDKFVVVRIFFYQPKAILRIKAQAERAPQYRIDDVLRDERCCLLRKDFQVFADYFITDTHDISSFTERIPRGAVWTVLGDYLQEAVSVKDYVTHLLALSVWCTIMGILQVTKFLLIPFAVGPKLFHCLIGTLSKKLRGGRRKGISVLTHNSCYFVIIQRN